MAAAVSEEDVVVVVVAVAVLVVLVVFYVENGDGTAADARGESSNCCRLRRSGRVRPAAKESLARRRRKWIPT